MLNDDEDIFQETLNNTRDYITLSYNKSCAVYKHNIPEWLYTMQVTHGLYPEFEREEYEQEIPF